MVDCYMKIRLASMFLLGGVTNCTPNWFWIQNCLFPRLIANQGLRAVYSAINCEEK